MLLFIKEFDHITNFVIEGILYHLLEKWRKISRLLHALFSLRYIFHSHFLNLKGYVLLSSYIWILDTVYYLCEN